MTDIDQVRLLIGDTGSIQFTDAQIQAFLDMNGGVVKLAAASALEAWLSILIRQPTNETIGDYGYGKTALYLMANLAKQLRNEVAATPAFAYAEMDLLDSDEVADD